MTFSALVKTSRSSLRKALSTLLCLASFVWMTSNAQVLSNGSLSKAPPGVIEKSKQGLPQDLIVVLDRREIEARERQKRVAKGLESNDPAIQAETVKEFDDLKSSIFPGGQLDDAQVIRDFKSLPLLFVRVPSLRVLERILAHPAVEAVEANDRFYPALPQSLPLIGQPAAASGGKTGAGYRVAVIDSGLWPYRNPIWTTDGSIGCRFNVSSTSRYYWPDGPYFGTANCRISDAVDFSVSPPITSGAWNLSDNSGGHGTNVAGIVVGTAPGAKIAVLQVFNSLGVAYRANILAAIDWVVSNADRSPGKIVAANLSFGGSPYYSSDCSSSSYAGSFSRLRGAGVIPVVSSGNAGVKNALPEPSCAPGAVRVGSVYDKDLTYTNNWYDGSFVCADPAGIKADQVVCSSNSSSYLTLLAPGAYIDAGGVGAWGGTSQAAPHVAGAIAVLKQAFPNDSVTDATLRMTSTGKTVVDKANNIATPRLNLAAALATTVASGSGSGGGSGSGPTGAQLAAVNGALDLIWY